MNSDSNWAPATRRTATVLTVALSAAALSGCLGAAPWNHDLLAKREMALNTHPLVTAFHDHVFFSKEGSSGGRTFGGGGCGCN